MTEYDDAFLLSVAKSATGSLNPDDSPNEEAAIFTALGVSIFTSWLYQACGNHDNRDNHAMAICYRELMRELTPPAAGVRSKGTWKTTSSTLRRSRSGYFRQLRREAVPGSGREVSP